MLKFQTLLLLGLFNLSPTFAADKGEDYPGIDNPFQDPLTNYREEGSSSSPSSGGPRSFMIGLEGGLGLFTGGLGGTAAMAPFFGIRMVYFINHALALEGMLGFANHLDTTVNTQFDTTLAPLTGGLRLYVGPLASFARAYLSGGAGVYYRLQTDLTSSDIGEASQFGAYVGGGFEFPIVASTLYLGIDLRYHLIFFIDEDSTLGGAVAAGSRAGDYFTPTVTLMLNF